MAGVSGNVLPAGAVRMHRARWFLFNICASSVELHFVHRLFGWPAQKRVTWCRACYSF